MSWQRRFREKDQSMKEFRKGKLQALVFPGQVFVMQNEKLLSCVQRNDDDHFGLLSNVWDSPERTKCVVLVDLYEFSVEQKYWLPDQTFYMCDGDFSSLYVAATCCRVAWLWRRGTGELLWSIKFSEPGESADTLSLFGNSCLGLCGWFSYHLLQLPSLDLLHSKVDYAFFNTIGCEPGAVVQNKQPTLRVTNVLTCKQEELAVLPYGVFPSEEDQLKLIRNIANVVPRRACMSAGNHMYFRIRTYACVVLMRKSESYKSHEHLTSWDSASGELLCDFECLDVDVQQTAPLDMAFTFQPQASVLFGISGSAAPCLLYEIFSRDGPHTHASVVAVPASDARLHPARASKDFY
eukprot:gnl/Hemi2/2528_TR894_c0_g1_i1.p1 gnl/Hemi2/2528_TR894_c0_g1~~gnl/Hemi2/2528_TR894_c0_g1_i1.p1  ORF type:complete len:351 (+),score=7.22 gnl/Hemi2/2528_TR894_c0_g1_i1:67-1119(+)